LITGFLGTINPEEHSYRGMDLLGKEIREYFIKIPAIF
jgi:hypothetical protein